MPMKCPQCHTEGRIEETSKFDLTLVEPEECRHDFECTFCGSLFSFVYHRIEIRLLKGPDKEYLEGLGIHDPIS